MLLFYAFAGDQPPKALCTRAVRECVKVCEHDILQIAKNFHKIYNLCAVGDKDELIRFWGQKIKDQGDDETLNMVKNYLF